MNSIKEAIRRINIGLSSDKESSKVISFITPNKTNSQRTVVANLAMMYAQAGENVVILDVDFSSSAFSDTFGMKNLVGLSNFLDDKSISEEEVINKVPGQKVSLITSGGLPENETMYLVGDPRLKKMLQYLKPKYDRILINTADGKNIDEYAELLKMTDGSIIVYDLKYTSKKAALNMINKLVGAQTKVLGYISAKK